MTPEEVADSLAKPKVIVSSEARAFVKRCAELRSNGNRLSTAAALRALREHYDWPYTTTDSVRSFAEREFGAW